MGILEQKPQTEVEKKEVDMIDPVTSKKFIWESKKGQYFFITLFVVILLGIGMSYYGVYKADLITKIVSLGVVFGMGQVGQDFFQCAAKWKGK